MYDRCDCSAALASVDPFPTYQAGDPSPCLRGGNAFFLNGTAGDTMHPGAELFADTAFQVGWQGDMVRFEVFPTGRLRWQLAFGSERNEIPLGPRDYVGTREDWSGKRDVPALWVQSIGAKESMCEPRRGRFRVDQLLLSGGSLQAVTIVFETSCRSSSTPLQGCIHFEAPPGAPIAKAQPAPGR
jgi:hypothetical protein